MLQKACTCARQSLAWALQWSLQQLLAAGMVVMVNRQAAARMGVTNCRWSVISSSGGMCCPWG